MVKQLEGNNRFPEWTCAAYLLILELGYFTCKKVHFRYSEWDLQFINFSQLFIALLAAQIAERFYSVLNNALNFHAALNVCCDDDFLTMQMIFFC